MLPRPLEYIFPGILAAQAIHTAADFRIPDLLASGPRTASDLALDCGAHGPTLERLLRALTSIEVLQRLPDGRYRNSPFSETLRSDHPQSLRAEALFLPARHMWESIGKLSESVQTGRPAFNEVFGIGFFEYLSKNPEQAEIFDRVMTQEILWTTPAILRGYSFSSFQHLVDVGGGAGLFLSHVLRAAPSLRGTLFDQPHVLDRAKDLVPTEIADRLNFVGGSFFDRVPEGADAYVLRRVIHDWNDDDAGRILRNVRSAISPTGTLLIIEGLVDSPTRPVGLMDLMMLVLGGQERTQAEFVRLVEASGFSLARMVPAGTYSLIECKPT